MPIHFLNPSSCVNVLWRRKNQNACHFFFMKAGCLLILKYERVFDRNCYFFNDFESSDISSRSPKKDKQ